ncbi:hypothetical protein [Streptomyces olivochromogenes]|uniref:Uncharacterized protein n=1 Tax=Streptomyces olivochromogenes TaxID=1963 RepID=A0A250VG15_STROL|nr:hypothetical protein [Streptomyces olivochromogenes]KUN44366.1 hypothetical protein AQJ27_26590 [Streptomyces olivochromogenes]GAX53115.1 hypothetical protein SO3561_04640 [Streptomyces olivochromogenes]
MARKNTIIVNDDHTGDIGGTVISGNTGPVAMNGDIHDGDTGTDSKDTGRRTFSGKGMTVVEGDNHGTISRRF